MRETAFDSLGGLYGPPTLWIEPAMNKRVKAAAVKDRYPVASLPQLEHVIVIAGWEDIDIYHPCISLGESSDRSAMLHCLDDSPPPTHTHERISLLLQIADLGERLSDVKCDVTRLLGIPGLHA